MALRSFMDDEEQENRLGEQYQSLSYSTEGAPPEGSDMGSFSYEQPTTQQTQAPQTQQTTQPTQPTTTTSPWLNTQQTTTRQPLTQDQAPTGPADSADTRLMGELTDLVQKAQSGDATAREQLSTSVYSQLTQAGHDVQWEGDVLVVDGRRYTLAGGGTEVGGMENMPRIYDPSQQQQTSTTQPNTGSWNTDGYAVPGYTATNFGSAPSGWDPNKWNDPNHQTPKYVVGRISMEATGGTGQFSSQQQIDQAIQRILEAYPGATSNGRDRVTIPGVGTVDIIQDFDPSFSGGLNGVSFNVEGAGGQTVQDTDSGPSGPSGMITGGVSTTAGVGGGGYTPAPAPAFTPTAPRYTPGDITFDDIPSYTREQLMQEMDVSGLDPTALDQETEGFARNLLANPTTYGEREVAMLKAANKDELGEMLEADQENLTGLSYGAGIQDSSFIEAERNAARRDRDRALIAGNRDIDMTAAEKRREQELQALGAASEVGGRLFGQKRDQAALKQSAVSTATKAALDRSALVGDRMALREAVNQEATKLGIAADELMMRYVVAQIQDATQRHGIDADTGVAYAQLAQRDRQFAEDLAFRFAQLSQQDQQFGASYGLDFGRLALQRDELEYSKYRDDIEDLGT